MAYLSQASSHRGKGCLGAWYLKESLVLDSASLFPSRTLVWHSARELVEQGEGAKRSTGKQGDERGTPKKINGFAGSDM